MSNDKIMPTLSDDALMENQSNLVVSEQVTRMHNPAIMALRAQLPFLIIMPFTNQVSTYKLSAGVIVDVFLPSGAKLVRFSGTGNFIVSRGTAALPTGVHTQGECGIVNPQNTWYWIEEIASLSIVSRDGCDVSAEFFTQL